MKPSTCATIIICALIAALVTLVCTGHTDALVGIAGLVIAITFFLFA